MFATSILLCIYLTGIVQGQSFNQGITIIVKEALEIHIEITDHTQKYVIASPAVNVKKHKSIQKPCFDW